jgi:8-oxo-dGTP pyrophosphatase MutT (NUDIX family)
MSLVEPTHSTNPVPDPFPTSDPFLPELMQEDDPKPFDVGPQARRMVLAFAKPYPHEVAYNKVLLVRKPMISKFHPGWINLPGGHAEGGEHPADAAVRELKEETGLDGSMPQYMGALRPPPEEQNTPNDFVVWVYRLQVDILQPLHPEPDQPAYWTELDSIARMLTFQPDFLLVPNLTVILPLLVVGLQRNWVLEESANTTFADNTTATFKLHAPNASFGALQDHV